MQYLTRIIGKGNAMLTIFALKNDTGEILMKGFTKLTENNEFGNFNEAFKIIFSQYRLAVKMADYHLDHILAIVNKTANSPLNELKSKNKSKTKFNLVEKYLFSTPFSKRIVEISEADDDKLLTNEL